MDCRRGASTSSICRDTATRAAAGFRTGTSVVVDAYLSAHERTPSPNVHARERRGAIFLLVDSRHPGLASDLDAWRQLSGRARLHVVASKIDKLGRADRTRNLREFERLFGQTPLAVSITNGEGLDEIWRVIASAAKGHDPGHTGVFSA